MSKQSLNDLVLAANELADQVDSSLDYRPELRRALSHTHEALLRARKAAVEDESEGGTYGPRDYSRIANELLPAGFLEERAAVDARLEIADLRTQLMFKNRTIASHEETISLLKELVRHLEEN